MTMTTAVTKGQPVAFSGRLTDRMKSLLGGKPAPTELCAVGLNRESLWDEEPGDVFVMRRHPTDDTPCLGKEMIQTIMDFKAELAKILHASSIADLPQKGIIRIGLTLAEPGSASGKNVALDVLALDVLVDETKYLLVKGKVPHTYNGYDVYMHKASADNPPIT